MKGAVEQAKPWTERHVAEVKAALYRLAAEEVVTGSQGRAKDILGLAFKPESTESASRFLMRLWLIDPNRSEEDRQSILRRVRDRAEGREVVEVETFYRVKLANGRYEANDDDAPRGVSVEDAWRSAERDRAVSVMACEPGSRVVKVTLTRRRIVSVTKGGK